jgi:uncharacterized membrane protein YcaP (DUF421 family)
VSTAAFFTGWSSVGRVVVVGACAYVLLVCMVRIAGKRSLAKMNAFDLVVTVALGSTLSTILLSRDVPLLDGVVAIGLLLALQASVAWSSVKWPAFARAVKSSPAVLYDTGNFNWRTMRSERVTREEVLAAVRSQGLTSLDEVARVMIESNGELSVQALPKRL